MTDSPHLTLPTELSGVDPRFLTAALGQRYPGTEVGALELTDVRQGSASSVKLHIDYVGNPHNLPPSMFMKGNFVDHTYTPAAAFAGEVFYYNHLADALHKDVRQPRAYFAGIEGDQQAIVIMEDLGMRNVRFGDCDEPLDVDTVADGVRQLAAMSARFWQRRGLEKYPSVTEIETVAGLMVFLVQPDHFNEYVGRERADFLSPALRDREKVESALLAMFATDKDLPKAVAHGDAHIGNTFRETSGHMGFFDFQAVGVAPCVWDLTYFIGGSLEPEDRSAAERDLLRLYLDELRSRGVEDAPSFDTLFNAHRRHMMHGFLSILTPVEMQADRFAVTMGRRFATAIEELDTLGSFD